MDNSFEIPVTYQSKEFNFPAELITMGYTYRIEVNVFGKLISFEPDEEQNFRGLVHLGDLNERDQIDKALLETIGSQLVLLFKD